MTVRNAAPQLTGVSITSPIWPLTSATLGGILGDPSPLDTFQLVVNWGDGSVLQTNTFPAGGGPFRASSRAATRSAGSLSQIRPASALATRSATATWGETITGVPSQKVTTSG